MRQVRNRYGDGARQDPTEFGGGERRRSRTAYAAVAVLAALTIVLGAATAPARASGPSQAVVADQVSPLKSSGACGTYRDVSASFVHCKNILWLTGRGITKPVDPAYFHPASHVTRGQMMAFLYRQNHPGKAQPRCTSAPYRDVPVKHKFCGYITWAKKTHVTAGVGDGTRFAPGDRVTRGQAVAFLHRIITDAKPQSKCSSKPFPDVATNHSFCGFIDWAKKNHYTSGVAGGCAFASSEPVSRGAMASFLHRIERPGAATPSCSLPAVRAVVKYRVVTDGTITTDVGAFRQQVQETLTDGRGWRAAGIEFRPVSSGASMTVVLANANRVESYAPAVCSSKWSCRVGNYVIINQDRWKYASPAWNDAGGTLREYRHMVVNHESGHWLGWRHRDCTGAGDKAPVMQQQSIRLSGCTFNPWPLKSELKVPRFN